MATETNGIATRGDLNELLPLSNLKFWTSNLTKCPIYSDISNIYYSTSTNTYRINISGTYSLDQLVKYSSCSLFTGELNFIISVNILSISPGAGVTYDDTWLLEGNICTSRKLLKIDIYNGNTIIKTGLISVLFSGELDGTEINNVYGTTEETYSFPIPKSLTVTKLVLTCYGNWGAISVGSTHNETINTDKTINWNPVTIEFYLK